MTLVPQKIGAENYALDPVAGVTAFPGTGFDPENVQHMVGSDAARYAIAIQQNRDANDYAAVDAARAMAESMGYFVMQERAGTRVKAMPLEWRAMSASRRKAIKIDSFAMPIVDGIIYDCARP